MRYRGARFEPSGPADFAGAGHRDGAPAFQPGSDMSVVDNVLLGRQRGLLNRAECARQLEKLAVDYGLPLDPLAKIEDLSVGERQRVEIVKCLIRDPSLFVLDEPTAVLLPDEIAALLDVCRRVAVQRTCGRAGDAQARRDQEDRGSRHGTARRTGRRHLGQSRSRDRRAGPRHDPGQCRDRWIIRPPPFSALEPVRHVGHDRGSDQTRKRRSKRCRSMA